MLAGFSLLAALTTSPASSHESDDHAQEDIASTVASAADGTEEYDNPFERGAYPVEEPWLSGLISLRALRGLPADRELVAELMSSEDAQRQMADYDVLVTPEEEIFIRAFADVTDYSQRVLEVVVDADGYAGGTIDLESERPSLQVFVTESLVSEAERLISKVEGPATGSLDVSVVKVDFSFEELLNFAVAINGELGVDTEAEVALGPEQVRAVEQVAAVLSQRDDLSDVVMGFSMENNGLVVQVSKTDRVGPIDLGPGLPSAVVEVVQPGEDHHDGHDGDTPDDQGPAACGDWFCGAMKAGVYTDISTGNACTWSPGLQVRATANGPWLERSLTAGHCGDEASGSSADSFYLFPVDGTISSVAAHFTPSVSKTPTTLFGSEYRNSLERSGNALGDFNLITTTNGTNNNLMMIAHGFSSRVQSIATVTVGHRVCPSLPHVPRNVSSRCDRVDSVGRTKTIGGVPVYGLASTRGSYEGERGDSGGPLYTEGQTYRIAGVHQGEMSINWQNHQVFSIVNSIDHPSSNMGIASMRTARNDGERDFLQNLYVRLLNRQPDVSGWNFWSAQLDGNCTDTQASWVARNFLTSHEFLNVRFPMSGPNKVINAQLRVWYSYRTFFGRDPDSSGWMHWYNTVLADGGYTEAAWLQVINGHSNSVEFYNRTWGYGAMPADGWICN